MLEGCGYTEVDDMPQEFTLSPSPRRTGNAVNVPVSRFSEGTWLPSLGGTATYTLQEGYFTNVGQFVFVQAYLIVNTIGTGSVNTISGLPIPCLSRSIVAVGETQNLVTAVVSLAGRIAEATSTIVILSRTVASDNDSIVNNIFQDGTVLSLSGVYMADHR